VRGRASATWLCSPHSGTKN